MGQGRENAKNYLAEHPEMAQDIDKKVRAMLAEGKEPPVAEVIGATETTETAETAETED